MGHKVTTGKSLFDYMLASTTRRFAWGQWDCCLLVADVVRILTGQDPATAWRGTYATEEEAQAVWLTLGGADAILSLLGTASDKRPVDGDIGIVSAGTTTKEGLAVFWQGQWVAPSRHRGLQRVPLSRIRRVYRCRR
jgi:hypothetical protein